jgi:hypothetical protein
MHGKCYVCQQVTPRGRHLTRVAVTEAAAAAARAANEEARRASKSASSDLYAAAPLEIKPLYNLLEREEREDIEAVRLSTRYGAKLQLLVQHVLHISQTQTATKLIVFSSFSRGLDLVSQALKTQALRHVRVDTGGRVAARQVDAFRNSRDTNVLLLHSEAQSAGLNLTCASVVILLVSLGARCNVACRADACAPGTVREPRRRAAGHRPRAPHRPDASDLGLVSATQRPALLGAHTRPAAATRPSTPSKVRCLLPLCPQTLLTRVSTERICSAQVARGTSLYVLANARSAEIPDAASVAASDGRAAAPATTPGPRSKKGPPGEQINSVRELLACFLPEKVRRGSDVPPVRWQLELTRIALSAAHIRACRGVIERCCVRQRCRRLAPPPDAGGRRASPDGERLRPAAGPHRAAHFPPSAT